MNKGTLYISCGLPGSGKTTFLNEIKGDNEVSISRDDIRFSLLKPGEQYFAHETQVFNTFITTIAEYINKGINVYADATHLNASSRNKLIFGLKRIGCEPDDIVAIFFDIPFNICLERNEKRLGTERYVKRNIIEQMSKNMSVPNLRIENNISELYIVDEDGCIIRKE